MASSNSPSISARLPLTTVFSAPASCSSHWTYEGDNYNNVQGGLLIQNAVGIDADCFPSGFSNIGRASQTQVFSPGVCPSGYVTQLQRLDQTVTSFTCCQSSFTYTSILTTYSFLSTLSHIYPASARIFAGCISTFTDSQTVVPARNMSDLIPSTTVNGPLTMWGQAIVVARQDKDVSLLPITTSTTSLSSTAQAASTGSQIPEQTSAVTSATSLSTKQASGLSTGAKAGIVIGAVVGALFLFGLAFGLLQRRRRKVKKTSMYPNEFALKHEEHKPQAELSATREGRFGEMSELNAPLELDSTARSELATANAR